MIMIPPGMLGFMWMVGTRAYLMVQAKPWNINPASVGDENNCSMAVASVSMVAASFLLMISIVNRAVANGGGQAGESYGGSIASLFGHYLTLLFEQATGMAVSPVGPLEIMSLLFGATSLLFATKAIFMEP